MNEDISKMEKTLVATNLQPGCNEPLTLEQLRGMNRPTPVWVEVKEKTVEGWSGYWCLCTRGHILTPGLVSMYAEKMDGVRFYAYPHAHIECSKWEPFETIGGTKGLVCKKCGYREYNHVKFTQFPFCPECGRPMTE